MKLLPAVLFIDDDTNLARATADLLRLHLRHRSQGAIEFRLFLTVRRVGEYLESKSDVLPILAIVDHGLLALDTNASQREILNTKREDLQAILRLIGGQLESAAQFKVVRHGSRTPGLEEARIPDVELLVLAEQVQLDFLGELQLRKAILQLLVGSDHEADEARDIIKKHNTIPMLPDLASLDRRRQDLQKGPRTDKSAGALELKAEASTGLIEADGKPRAV